MKLTAEHRAILEDAIKNDLLCGDSPEMQELCAVDFMEPYGRGLGIQGQYFRCTTAGRAVFDLLNHQEAL